MLRLRPNWCWQRLLAGHVMCRVRHIHIHIHIRIHMHAPFGYASAVLEEASTLFVRVAGRLIPGHNFRFTPNDLVNIYLTVKRRTCASLFPLHSYSSCSCSWYLVVGPKRLSALLSPRLIYLCSLVSSAHPLLTLVLVMIIAVFITDATKAEKFSSALNAGKCEG